MKETGLIRFEYLRTASLPTLLLRRQRRAVSASHGHPYPLSRRVRDLTPAQSSQSSTQQPVCKFCGTDAMAGYSTLLSFLTTVLLQKQAASLSSPPRDERHVIVVTRRRTRLGKKERVKGRGRGHDLHPGILLDSRTRRPTGWGLTPCVVRGCAHAHTQTRTLTSDAQLSRTLTTTDHQPPEWRGVQVSLTPEMKRWWHKQTSEQALEEEVSGAERKKGREKKGLTGDCDF